MPAAEFAHHYANLEGVRIHFVTLGNGAPVVLLHGWPQTWYEWRRVMPLLADKYSLVAPDLRGLGDSTRPASGYDKKTVANDIWLLMHEHLKHPRFAVVGHDWGAPVAFRVAADHPAEVTHLAMLDVPVPGDQPAGAAIGGTPRWWHMFHQVPDLPESLVYGRERLYLEWFYMNGCDQAGAIGDDDIAEYVRTYSQPGAMRAGFNFYRALSRDVCRQPRHLCRGIQTADADAGTRRRRSSRPRQSGRRIAAPRRRSCVRRRDPRLRPFHSRGETRRARQPAARIPRQ